MRRRRRHGEPRPARGFLTQALRLDDDGQPRVVTEMGTLDDLAVPAFRGAGALRPRRCRRGAALIAAIDGVRKELATAPAAALKTLRDQIRSQGEQRGVLAADRAVIRAR